MSLSEEQKDKYSTLFGLGLAAIGTFNTAVASFVYNVLGGGMLTILFLLLFIFIIWIFWNRSRANVHDSTVDKLNSEKEVIKAERELKEEEKKGMSSTGNNHTGGSTPNGSGPTGGSIPGSSPTGGGSPPPSDPDKYAEYIKQQFEEFEKRLFALQGKIDNDHHHVIKEIKDMLNKVSGMTLVADEKLRNDILAKMHTLMNDFAIEKKTVDDMNLTIPKIGPELKKFEALIIAFEKKFPMSSRGPIPDPQLKLLTDEMKHIYLGMTKFLGTDLATKLAFWSTFSTNMATAKTNFLNNLKLGSSTQALISLNEIEKLILNNDKDIKNLETILKKSVKNLQLLGNWIKIIPLIMTNPATYLNIVTSTKKKIKPNWSKGVIEII